MESPKLFIFLLISILEINAQYNNPPPPPYDRDHQYDRDRQNNPQYGQPYDRQNQPYNQPYDRQYNQQPYDRDRDRQYNQTQYGRYNQSQYGNQNPPYGNRDPYDRQNNNQGPPYGQYDQYNRDPYNNRSRPYGDPYNNRSQYGDNRDQYDRNRDQYNRDQYDRNRDQYDRNRDQQYGNRDQYGQNRGQQYNGNRDRDQYNVGNRDQYGNPDFGGPQYGSPLSETNDNCCQDYCYSEDSNPYVKFATKTAYQLVFGKNSQQHRVPECTPIQFWSINRHGTRFPSASAISRLRQLHKIQQEVIRNYDERRSFPDRGRLCPKDLDLFRKWRWNETLSEHNANMLTRQGTEDLKFLARRYASRFEELMRVPYSEQVYNFQYTNADRTHDSYQAFIEGLFRNDYTQVHANVHLEDDRLIKPTHSCNAWRRDVEENRDTLNEYMRFKHNQDYQQMVRDVFRRLGFRYTLNESILMDMYDMCRFEKAWDLNRPSPWCIVFNKEQLKMLEYAEDLKYYYKGGYGNPLNTKIGCPPLKDLYEKFERTVNGNTNGNKVTVFFTHSITIQTFLTAMGIARDDLPLRADNYYQQEHRKWRTSTIDPFASNLAAVLYECRSGERNRVMFFLNEVPVDYPDCAVGLCNWSTVKNKLQSASENCNLDFCDRDAATALQRSHIIYLISFIAIFFSFRL